MWYFVIAIGLMIGNQPSPVEVRVGGFQTKDLCEQIRARVVIHSMFGHSSTICRLEEVPK